MKPKKLLKPFSFLYQNVMNARNFLYDRDILKVLNLNKTVVSIGNLTVGGTGKTPFSSWLVQQLEEQNLKVGLVSRGYGRKTKGILEVAAHSPFKFGDEPVMLKTRFPETPVWVGESRFRAAQALIQKTQVDIILADDAFQHRELYRNLNIVLLDCTQNFESYKILPEGLARESLDSLQRADFIVYTKVNLVSPIEIKAIQNQVRPYIQHLSESSILMAEYCLGLPKPLKHEACAEWVPAGKKIAILSGIGRPLAFHKSCEDQLEIEISQAFEYADHHSFSVENCQEAAKTCDIVLITEKDAVKIRELPFDQSKFWMVPLELEISNFGELIEEIHRQYSQNN